MVIYIDSEYKCHVSNNDDFRAVETDLFDGKCDSYIEGYRYVPNGETWVRKDGTAFAGEMFAPWKSFAELDEAQREYERQEMAEMREALALLGVTVDE